MRILFIDIDTLRPDHLGCYGYQRNTSPNLDAIAAAGVRFEHCHVSDAPCLPSRSALISGQFGIHNGVIGHGGTTADPFVEGQNRGFRSTMGGTNWMSCLRRMGLKTVSISPFGERHSAWWWYAGFSEIHNTGKGGMEGAEEVAPVAIDWLKRNGKDDNWFLHVNMWDPHTPYRAPAAFGEPFKDDPVPAWLTEDVRQTHWNGCGPHSAREVRGFGPPGDFGKWPRQPDEIASMVDVRKMFDGYDTGIKYADEYVGRLMNTLADLGIAEETAIVVSSDHGENLGELNIYGDHHTADEITSRVPLIIKWPGISPGVDEGMHYQVDYAATVIELAGGKVPGNWDGRSFAKGLKQGKAESRDHLIVSQGAWTCQRTVKFDSHLYMRTYHDCYHSWPDVMLYDLAIDPHEQHNIAAASPSLCDRGASILENWTAEMMRSAAHPHDPMWTVMREGGPFHGRGELRKYLARLRETGRPAWAEKLSAAHPGEY